MLSYGGLKQVVDGRALIMRPAGFILTCLWLLPAGHCPPSYPLTRLAHLTSGRCVYPLGFQPRPRPGVRISALWFSLAWLDFAQTLGSDGFVDFFLSKASWAIELLRDSIQVQSHLVSHCGIQIRMVQTQLLTCVDD